MSLDVTKSPTAATESNAPIRHSVDKSNSNSLVRLIDFQVRGDARGSLVALESNHEIPFELKRAYYIFGTKERIARGFHAHKKLKQVAICLSGSCRFILDDGIRREGVTLESPSTGLFIEGLKWREMHDFSPDCVLLVFASEHYDESDYIRDYDEFLHTVNKD